MNRLALSAVAVALMAMTVQPTIAQAQEQLIFQPRTLPAIISGGVVYMSLGQRIVLPGQLKYPSGLDYIDYSKYPSLDYSEDEFIIAP